MPQPTAPPRKPTGGRATSEILMMVMMMMMMKIFEGKLEGRRGRVRPRLRWINDVEDNLRKLSVRRWRTKALEREEWASIIKEAKAKLEGP